MKHMKRNRSKYLDKRFWLDLILPNRCAICGDVIVWDELCCKKCSDSLPYIDIPVCKVCGLENCVCSRGISYDRCFSIVWYDEFMKNAVVNFKKQSPENFALLFGNKLAEKLKADLSEKIDIVTAVPMSKRKLAQNGYNQAFELAKSVSAEMSLPARDDILVRKYSRVSQHELSYSDRQETVKELYSFSGDVDVSNKTVLLCDDIITTGSTLNECSRILKENGAKYVICATAAHTRLKSSENK